MRSFFLLVLGLCLSVAVFAQKDFYKDYPFTEADSLRGMLRPERTCFDVTFYRLNIKVNPAKKFIKGLVDIHYDVKEDFTVLQLDLWKNMKIEKIEYNGRTLEYDRRHDAVFVGFQKQQKKGTKGKITVHYSGNPHIAKQPPWDGGFVWSKDANKKDWIGVACEGDGASLWWPNKDHLSDEPDSMRIQCAVPSDLMCIANGTLVSQTKQEDDYTLYDWAVSYPINNYNVTLNIADYAHFSDKYTSKKTGETLDLDYYVLKENLEKAKPHFEQTKGTLEAFEDVYGPYPFWKDGFALVETPYLGMEHQGAIAYGNQYKDGYLGYGLPKGIVFDYIIIHETGHEYWGNSLSCNDLAEMWIHESFTTYMEAQYVEYHYGFDDAIRYLMTQRPNILNQQPIIGPKDVNWEDWEGGDHYYKGAWMLHTLRSAIDDDKLWRKMLYDFHQENKISNIVSQDWFDFVKERTGKDYGKFFEQYLEYTDVPVLECKVKQKRKKLIVSYRWVTDVKGFEMPIKVGKKGEYKTLNATNDWQKVKLKGVKLEDFKVAKELFLVDAKIKY